MIEYGFIIDQLTNNEDASDDELIEHLSKETGGDINTLTKMVKECRSEFLTNPLMDIETAMHIITSYI